MIVGHSISLNKYRATDFCFMSRLLFFIFILRNDVMVNSYICRASLAFRSAEFVQVIQLQKVFSCTGKFCILPFCFVTIVFNEGDSETI